MDYLTKTTRLCVWGRVVNLQFWTKIRVIHLKNNMFKNQFKQKIILKIQINLKSIKYKKFINCIHCKVGLRAGSLRKINKSMKEMNSNPPLR